MGLLGDFFLAAYTGAQINKKIETDVRNEEYRNRARLNGQIVYTDINGSTRHVETNRIVYKKGYKWVTSDGTVVWRDEEKQSQADAYRARKMAQKEQRERIAKKNNLLIYIIDGKQKLNTDHPWVTKREDGNYDIDVYGKKFVAIVKYGFVDYMPIELRKGFTDDYVYTVKETNEVLGLAYSYRYVREHSDEPELNFRLDYLEKILKLNKRTEEIKEITYVKLPDLKAEYATDLPRMLAELIDSNKKYYIFGNGECFLANTYDELIDFVDSNDRDASEYCIIDNEGRLYYSLYTLKNNLTT